MHVRALMKGVGTAKGYEKGWGVTRMRLRGDAGGWGVTRMRLRADAGGAKIVSNGTTRPPPSESNQNVILNLSPSRRHRRPAAAPAGVGATSVSNDAGPSVGCSGCGYGAAGAACMSARL